MQIKKPGEIRQKHDNIRNRERKEDLIQKGETEQQNTEEEEEGHEGEKDMAGAKKKNQNKKNRSSRVPLLHGPTVRSFKASLTSPSAMSLCLSFQTLAQRISKAHAHTSANKHTAQSNPCRYRHALILTAKVLKT